MSADVVRLIDRAPGFGPEDSSGLMEFAQNWLDAFKEGRYGEFKSLTFLIESKDGRVATVTSAMIQMDGIRLAGLLNYAATLKLSGEGQIDDLDTL